MPAGSGDCPLVGPSLARSIKLYHFLFIRTAGFWVASGPRLSASLGRVLDRAGRHRGANDLINVTRRDVLPRRTASSLAEARTTATRKRRLPTARAAKTTKELSKCVHSHAPVTSARRHHLQGDGPPGRAWRNRLMTAVLPASFGTFAMSARSSSSGYEAIQDLIPAGWLPFRRFEPPLSGWRQSHPTRVSAPVGFAFPLLNEFRLFRCSS